MRIGHQIFVVLALVGVVAFGVWMIKQTGQRDTIPINASSFEGDGGADRAINLSSTEVVPTPARSTTSRPPAEPPPVRTEPPVLRNPSPVAAQPPPSTPANSVPPAEGDPSAGRAAGTGDNTHPNRTTELPPAIPGDPTREPARHEPPVSSEIERPVTPTPRPEIRPEPPAERPAPAPAARTHTIVDNDTFAGLAKQYYDDESLYRAIELANPTLDARRLFVGAKVKIPSAEEARKLVGGGPAPAAPEASREAATPPTRAAERSDAYRIYVVEQDDSLAKIARLLLGSPDHWSQIYELNKDVISSPDKIRAGMRLRIPASAGTAPPRSRP